MNGKVSIFYDEIKRGFGGGNARNSRATKKPDFQVERFDQAPGLFGRSSLCADGTSFGYREEQD